MKTVQSYRSALLLIFFLTLQACSQNPHQTHYGSDECAYCRMMITDNQFAAQAVTQKGKSIKFDAIECMAAYAGEEKTELENARFWVSDFTVPGNWVEVDQAVIIRSEVINSPMGASLLAIGDADSASAHLAQFPAKKVQWEALVK